MNQQQQNQLSLSPSKWQTVVSQDTLWTVREPPQNPQTTSQSAVSWRAEILLVVTIRVWADQQCCQWGYAATVLKCNVNCWYKLELAQATEQNSCCTTYSLFKHPIHNIYTEMLPIHRTHMHLSRCNCPSYQMRQHHKHKAVFLDQTFNNYLLFNEPAASLSVSFNDTCHLPILCSNNIHNECVLCTGGVTLTAENWNTWRQAYRSNTLSTTSFT
jgi:hypothetical protein